MTVKKCNHKGEKCVSIQHHRLMSKVWEAKYFLLASKVSELIEVRHIKIPIKNWAIVFGNREAKVMMDLKKKLSR